MSDLDKLLLTCLTNEEQEAFKPLYTANGFCAHKAFKVMVRQYLMHKVDDNKSNHAKGSFETRLSLVETRVSDNYSMIKCQIKNNEKIQEQIAQIEVLVDSFTRDLDKVAQLQTQ